MIQAVTAKQFIRLWRKVTRANVIDKVEDYEGHKLDTSTYTYKEPEQRVMEVGASHL